VERSSCLTTEPLDFCWFENRSVADVLGGRCKRQVGVHRQLEPRPQRKAPGKAELQGTKLRQPLLSGDEATLKGRDLDAITCESFVALSE
jgi:hypothetical protein